MCKSGEISRFLRRSVWTVAASALCVLMLSITNLSPTVSAQEMMRDRPMHRQHDGGGDRGRGFGTGVGIGIGVGIGSMVIDQLQRQQAQDPRDVPPQSNVKKPRKKKDGSNTGVAKQKKKDDSNVAKKKGEPVSTRKKKEPVPANKNSPEQPTPTGTPPTQVSNPGPGIQPPVAPPPGVPGAPTNPPPTKVVIPPPGSSPPQAPGHTPVSAPPKEEQKICGPDITDLVLETLRQIKGLFEATARAGRSKSLSDACLNLINPQTGATAWDISALAPSGPPKDSTYDPATDSWVNPVTKRPYLIKPWLTGVSNRCAVPRPQCAATVEFMGTCQHAQVVNYTQWGMMLSLCKRFNPDIEKIGVIMHHARNVWKYGLDAPTKVQDNMVAIGKAYNETLSSDDYKKQKIIEDANNNEYVSKIRRQLQPLDQATDHPEKDCALVCYLTFEERVALRKYFEQDGRYKWYWDGLHERPKPKSQTAKQGKK